VFCMRGLAMRFGPQVLVNAVGAGAIVDEASGSFVAGAQAMLSHVPTGQPGAICDLVDAVLFLCDPMNSYMTGQVLTVDGGWSAGYGRNF
jgi:NAD(P)-dependent dehydrogenase (short-subunit alcohol dehydrogenase family)